MKDNCNVRPICADNLFGHKDIPEDGLTYKDNALIKAEAYYALLKNNAQNNNIDYIVSEDTGLEVKCLNNEPGLYTARYSVLDYSDDVNAQANNIYRKDNSANIRINNINKLLKKMKSKKDCIYGREAKFVCWACLYDIKERKHNFFYGELNGSITEELIGTAGFGYDPIFYVPEFNKTLAELSKEIKNKISHRANAFNKVINFININNKNLNKLNSK
jgi:XTP/dITP diphosphohydrolase